MNVFMLGVDHQTAPLELRERLAIGEDRLDEAYERLVAAIGAGETVILSTCNRTEVYVAQGEDAEPAREQVTAFLCAFCGIGRAALDPATRCLEGTTALSHLFELACGLNSMVLGESEILGQLRRAYEAARQRGAVGPAFHRLFQRVMASAKKARTDTGIGDGRMSIATVAVDYARRIYERFDDKTVLAIGAGQIAKPLLRHLMSLRPRRLNVCNRTSSRAETLAESIGLDPAMGGVVSFDCLDDLLVEADIVLTSTGSTRPVLDVDRMRAVQRRRGHRAQFIIDIAVPRDVDPAVASIRNVYVYDLDDLQAITGQTADRRRAEAEQCRRMLRPQVEDVMREIRQPDVGLVIRALRQRLHALGREEQERTAARLAGTPADQWGRLLEEHDRRLVNKILHLPMKALDGRSDGVDTARIDDLATAVCRLFQLDADPDDSANPSSGEDEGQDAPTAPQIKDAKRQPAAPKTGGSRQKPGVPATSE
ncbi:MAG: glutamyl-tRNA reductase [Phycisphaeraceae bacterium]|nr:glutamyl-tRNA reductase [Phycisphaeraceae bacterium]